MWNYWSTPARSVKESLNGPVVLYGFFTTSSQRLRNSGAPFGYPEERVSVPAGTRL